MVTFFLMRLYFSVHIYENDISIFIIFIIICIKPCWISA